MNAELGAQEGEWMLRVQDGRVRLAVELRSDRGLELVSPVEQGLVARRLAEGAGWNFLEEPDRVLLTAFEPVGIQAAEELGSPGKP
jgi:hypothetical protein